MDHFDVHSLFVVSQPMTLATWSKACIVLYCSNAGTATSDLLKNACIPALFVCLFVCLLVLSCIATRLAVDEFLI